MDRTDYGPRIWAHILRDQLEVDGDGFWTCVRGGVKPDRGGVAAPPAEAIPVGVVLALVEKFGIPEAEVRAMSREQAIRRMVEGYSSEMGS